MLAGARARKGAALGYGPRACCSLRSSRFCGLGGGGRGGGVEPDG